MHLHVFRIFYFFFVLFGFLMFSECINLIFCIHLFSSYFLLIILFSFVWSFVLFYFFSRFYIGFKKMIVSHFAFIPFIFFCFVFVWCFNNVVNNQYFFCIEWRVIMIVIILFVFLFPSCCVSIKHIINLFSAPSLYIQNHQSII